MACVEGVKKGLESMEYDQLHARSKGSADEEGEKIFLGLPPFARTQANKRNENRPFPSCYEPHYESAAKCKVFVMKISCHLNAKKN